MSKNIYVGFDFSMNKPAATIYSNGKYFFYFWPLNFKNNAESKIQKYKDCGVNVVCRNLESISPSKKTKNTELVLVHTIRSLDLANLIIADIDNLINNVLKLDSDYNMYVCSEGLSYASKGDATLNLATYKGVLLAKIYEHYDENLKRLFTYSPNTLKSTAGCATKEKRSEKLPMIKAFINEPYNFPFKNALINGDLTAKTNYIEGVDDLCDSYWALRTMIKEEKLVLD